jgi:hypothetical protein
MSQILTYLGVTEIGSPLQRLIDPVSEDLVIGAGLPWPGGYQLVMAATTTGSWTLDFTVQFLNLPADFVSPTISGMYVGHNSAPGGMNGGLLFSKLGVAWAPCVRLLSGNFYPDTFTLLPGSDLLISEGEYYSIRIAVSTASNKSYIYITKTADLPIDGHQLRYILAGSPSSLCLDSQARTIISVTGNLIQNVLALDSICLGDGLIVPNTCDPITTYTAQVLSQWGLGQWGLNTWGGTGTYTFTVVGAGAPNPTSVDPNVGSTLGGDQVAIAGTDLATDFFNDTFSDGILNTVLWGQLGINPVVEGPLGPSGMLSVDTGVLPGSFSGLESIALRLLGDFYDQIGFSVTTQFLKNKPSSEVALAVLEAKEDDGNLIRMSYIVSGPSASGGTIKCEVWKSGTLRHIFTQPYSGAEGTLGIMRFQDTVENDNRAAFWLNGNKIFQSFDAPDCDLTLRFYAYNGASPYQVQTSFDNFVAKSVVLFRGPGGVQPAAGVTEVSEFRLRVLTPPTTNEWAGLVDILVTNGSATCCRGVLSNAFTYQFPEAFVVGRSQPFRPTDKELSLTNDPVLRNIGPNVGNGLRKQF